ncbi:alpha/beta hydrolase [Pedobacter boryungensis]|uniref:Alpha/beta hydrolase n=1 Tax=Pedobacter boryungensis TaxID=869962 RepID=A0ABX2DDM8_9SPHI|nr:alpha/beta hydrolase [Pedobacter boryungensis]NQX31927.1 alpha/beta hydrolase [Pedobacter boryungensis]
MKKLFIFVFSLFIVMEVNAQQVIPLYNGAIPGAKTPPADYKETTVTGDDGVKRVSKVTDPSLTAYIPAKPNGTAVIICPGGGYGILAIDKEGNNVAKKFNEVGITAFVLKYRLPSDIIMDDKSMGPLQDALQAIYLIRKNANVWGIDPTKIGVMGFSAGGHLAASLSVHYNDMKVQNQENISLRPNFSVLIYPVINFGNYAHAGSVKNLVGEQPTDAQRRYFSAEMHVDAQTPPTFLVHANNDGSVPVKNSLAYDEALAKHKVLSEMHIYQAGGHGFGLNNTTTKENWFETLKNWMRTNNLL